MYQLKSIANFRLGTGAAEILHKGKARSISVMFHIYCIANALQLLIQVKPTDVTWNQFKSHMKSWEIAGAWICSLLCWCDWLRLMHLKIMWDHAIWCIFYPWIHLAPVAESPILVSIGFYTDAIKKKKTIKNYQWCPSETFTSTRQWRFKTFNLSFVCVFTSCYNRCWLAQIFSELYRTVHQLICCHM